MKEICIPVPGFGEDQIADVTLTVGNQKVCYSYRVESFPWSIEQTDTKSPDEHEHATPEQIMQLRKYLGEYDKGWELIQILTPSRGASHIQVLYRKKNSNA
ncbi:MAG: hypothetical protein RBT74_01935 [Tenuifilaceae bacterium]|jgi:hypothetical protein|nr:hypothetical protein [Tenuifilaceae bacterium]